MIRWNQWGKVWLAPSLTITTKTTMGIHRSLATSSQSRGKQSLSLVAPPVPLPQQNPLFVSTPLWHSFPLTFLLPYLWTNSLSQIRIHLGGEEERVKSPKRLQGHLCHFVFRQSEWTEQLLCLRLRPELWVFTLHSLLFLRSNSLPCSHIFIASPLA